jgi:hypothetical protein
MGNRDDDHDPTGKELLPLRRHTVLLVPGSSSHPPKGDDPLFGLPSHRRD